MHQRDREPEGALPAGVRGTLELPATGLTSHEVAARIGRPVEDVHEQVASAIRQLGAASKLDAIVKASARGSCDLTGSA